MTFSTSRFGLKALLAASTLIWGISSNALASDSGASSASSVASKGIGSLSDSLQGSSNSSSGKERVAQGRYQITHVAQAPDAAGRVQLTLQADQAAPVVLNLPQPIVQQAGLAQGLWVDVQHRDFGLAFALATAREPFFLVLDEAWQRELDSRPVVM